MRIFALLIFKRMYAEKQEANEMDFVTGNSERMMESSMRFLWQKQTAILDNISNVETPGYKTKYVTFEESLKQRLQADSSASNAGAAYRKTLEELRPTARTADSESTRMDGNGVNLTEQGVELSRNTYQLRYVMNSINGNLNILRSAIKGQ